MDAYRQIAPTVFVAFGVTLPELFEHAASAGFSLVADPATITPTYSWPVVAPGDTMDELLVNWIGELALVAHEEGIVPSFFVVDRLEEGGVQGSLSGLPRDQVDRDGALHGSIDPKPSIVVVPDGFWAEVHFDHRQ
ncbi:MAG: archease [Acidimicrobiia bacterium]|nr:archease [Acidimicrobiia bacterium]